MFAGNIGKAQSIDTIVKAAALLKNDVRFKFHIVGAGSELDNIKNLAAELKTDNVIFYGQRPLEDMPGLYKIADAMLVTLGDKPYANMTIPGKVQSYMAAGKPIIGAINGSCANFINNYMEVYRHYYSKNQVRDDAFMKDLADAFIGISAILEVYARNFKIHPNYVLEKLKWSKGIIDSVIRFYEAKDE